MNIKKYSSFRRPIANGGYCIIIDLKNTSYPSQTIINENEFSCGNIYSYYSQTTSGPRQVSMCYNSNVFCIVEGYKVINSKYSLSEDIVSQYNQNNEVFLAENDYEASFFLFDSNSGNIISSRDSSCVFDMFYLADNKNYIVISNDVKCILPFSDHKLSIIGVSFYLKYGWLYGPYTLFENIYAILPFTALVFSSHELRKRINLLSKIVYYWKPNAREDYANLSDSQLAETYTSLLVDNIKQHTMGNNAVFFSGGLDSAVVTSVLSSLDVNTTAYKWSIKNLAPYELPLVNSYFKNVNVGNKILNIDVQGDDYFEKYSDAIIKNPISPTYTDYITQETVRVISRDLGEETMVFNGELVLLDAGFSEVNNPTRNIRRELYLNSKYPKFIARRSNIIGSIFAKGNILLDKFVLDHFVGFGIPKPLSYALGTLSSFGNINRYYSGLLLGKRGFPGWSTYFPRWLNSAGADHFRTRVTNEFVAPIFNNVDLERPALSLNFFKYQMYSICSNQSMYTNASRLGGLNQTLPFNNKKILELTSNLPLNLWKDKNVQRISAREHLQMPEMVANYPKNQKEPIPPYKTLYSKSFFEEAKRILANPSFINHLDESLINSLYLENMVEKTTSNVESFSPDILNLQLIVNKYF